MRVRLPLSAVLAVATLQAAWAFSCADTEQSFYYGECHEYHNQQSGCRLCS